MKDHDVELIAATLHVMRPDWPAAQIRTLIRENLLDRPFRDVFVALSWVAGDVDSSTPYRVLNEGPWWKAAAADRVTKPRPDHVETGALCSVCSQPESRCRQLWATDHAYVSNDELHRQVDELDPLEQAWRIEQLRQVLKR